MDSSLSKKSITAKGVKMANNQANLATVAGIGLAIVGSGATGGLSLLGIPAVLVARAYRATLDREEQERREREKEKEEERKRNMDRNLVPYYPRSHGFDFTPFVRVEPESVLAEKRPDFGFKILETMAQAKLLESAAALLNTESVAEMVRKHSFPSGIKVEVRSRRTIFGTPKNTIKISVS